MIQKKVCLLGSSAVGKTSLIRRFVHSIFSDKYLTTVGVRIDRKEVDLEGRTVNLLLWDLHGDDEYQRVRASYLRGAGGCFLVADGTRRTTLDRALLLGEEFQDTLGDIPVLLLLNKADLTEDWEISEEVLDELHGKGWELLKTSAKTGEHVEESFRVLARAMLGAGGVRPARGP